MASQTYTVTGINIKSINYSEADKIITIFTRENGILQVIAKGGRKNLSKLGARMDLLHCNRLFLTKGKNLDILTQAETYIYFPGLRNDYTKLMQALYWAELVYSFCNEGETLPDIFDLFLNSLAILEKAEQPPLLYTLWFELKFLEHIGYSCNFTHCVGCQRLITRDIKNFYFDLTSGSILCPSCQIVFKQVKPITRELYLILRKLKQFSLSDISSVTINEKTEKNIECIQNFFQTYICFLAEKKLKTISFLQ